jgi:protein involved in polysaccharide export with SLBB domain
MKKILSVLLIVAFLSPTLSSAILAFEYTLAPNDTLEIKILNKKDLDTKQTIVPDGTISLPFLGRITASGKTLSAFEATDHRISHSALDLCDTARS